MTTEDERVAKLLARHYKVGRKEQAGLEIKFLEEWLEMYSEGEHRMLVCERDISDRIKELKLFVLEVDDDDN